MTVGLLASPALAMTIQEDVVVGPLALPNNRALALPNNRVLQDKKKDTCTIFIVPPQIREREKTAYTPNYVSIGPYHYPSALTGDKSHLMAMQQHKRRCVRFLLARHVCASHNKEDNPSGASLENESGWDLEMRNIENQCLEKLRDSEKRARKCYFGRIPMNSDEFVEMMMEDACFIIYVLMKRHIRRETDLSTRADQLVSLEFKNKKAHTSKAESSVNPEEEVVPLGSITREQENELFGILPIWSWVLYDLLLLENQIPSFIVCNIFAALKTAEDKYSLAELALDLFRFLHPRSNPNTVVDSTPKLEFEDFDHLLHFYHQSLLPPKLHTSIQISEQDRFTEWVPSATELVEVGIKFEVGSSESTMDIKFEKGQVKIPPLHIYNYSIILFRNLMALEQCSPVGPYFTFYMLFMSSLMKEGRDVRLLHLKGIIMNLSNTDEDVSVYCRNLCARMHYEYDKNYLNALFVNLRMYRERRWNRWRASLCRNYFGNPWVAISVIAAIILLLLTIEQAFFAAFGYFKPPK